MNKQLQKEIKQTVQERSKRLIANQYRFISKKACKGYVTRCLRLSENLKPVFRVWGAVKYDQFVLTNVKKYNKTNATSFNKNFDTLSKKDLLFWCEMNEIKCAKSKKYSDIVKLLISSL